MSSEGAISGPDGVLLLDKPAGLTSNAALQRVKHLFRARRAGHAGSLDPLATGLLPICLGRATRLSGYVLDARKTYEVSGRLGARTATGDTEGEVVERRDWRQVDRDTLERAVAAHRGRIMQVPPMYSALKQGGERLYRKARRGEVVEREPRPVDIWRLDITAFEAPAFSLLVECSKGTYVRTLVEDIAAMAGSCGHVTSLRRLGAGPFEAAGMHTLAAIEARADAGPDSLADLLLPADSALAGVPQVSVDAGGALRLGQGQTLPAGGDAAPGLVRLYGPGGFLGVGELTADGRLAPRRLMGPESEA